MHHLSFHEIIFKNILMDVCINITNHIPNWKKKVMSFGVFQVNIYSFHFNQQITENIWGKIVTYFLYYMNFSKAKILSYKPVTDWLNEQTTDIASKMNELRIFSSLRSPFCAYRGIIEELRSKNTLRTMN